MNIPMEPIEIPIATPFSKLVAVACCVLTIVAILWWAAPKFRFFLRSISGDASRAANTRTIHIFLGFLVYAIVLAPAGIATLIGVGVAFTPPTVVYSAGVTGGTLLCTGARVPISFSCSSPFSFKQRRLTITWAEMERIECISRDDGTIGVLYIYSGSRRIEIGNFAVRDLTGVHDVILAHAPQSAARPCQTGF
jgi:hypothetical protein